MSGPLPQPADSPETLQYRHWRALAGLVGMGLAVVAAVGIQVGRAAREAALLARGCPVKEVILPTTWLQFTYSLAIPVGMPALLFLLSLMLFSPSVLGQMRTLLPWNKGGTTP